MYVEEAVKRVARSDYGGDEGEEGVYTIRRGGGEGGGEE